MVSSERFLSLLASVSSLDDDLRDRWTTSEEDYFSSVELERRKSTPSTTDTTVTSRYDRDYRKGLCRIKK